MIPTREEWEAMWAEMRLGKGLSLNAYAERVNRYKDNWAKRWPKVPWSAWSNERYVVCVEECLEKGVPIPQSIIATVTKDDVPYDSFCFPNLQREWSK